MGDAVDGPKDSTRDRLMRSTLKVIARAGYANATVAEIERDAGLSPGAGGLYRHFASKEELLVAAVRQYREEIKTWKAVVDEIAVADPSQAWESVPRALVKFGASQQTAIMALALEGLKFPAEARKEVQAAYNDGYALFAEGLEKFTGPTKKEVDFEAAAIQLFAGLVQFVTQTLAFGAPPFGVTLDRYMISWLRNWSLVIRGWRAGELSSDESPG
ncbi:MAG: TetR/AcrR family transcriptional regulator [Polyangiales bacterium]